MSCKRSWEGRIALRLSVRASIFSSFRRIPGWPLASGRGTRLRWSCGPTSRRRGSPLLRSRSRRFLPRKTGSGLPMVRCWITTILSSRRGRAWLLTRCRARGLSAVSPIPSAPPTTQNGRLRPTSAFCRTPGPLWWGRCRGPVALARPTSSPSFWMRICGSGSYATRCPSPM